MDNLKYEFGELIALYQKLGEELSLRIQVDDLTDPLALARSVLQNRDCLKKIELMNSRVALASDKWKKQRDYLDRKTRQETGDLVEAAKAQAAYLYDLCSVRAEKLKITCSQLEKNLGDLGKGARYLQNLKPVKNNYPKFIDSLH